MASLDIFRRGLWGEHRLGGMWIQIEEVISLVAYEVMAAAGPATCNSDGVRELKD